MGKYTQGEWHINPFDKREVVSELGAFSYQPICVCNVGSIDDQIANAQLISAAPDLLRACQQMIKAFADAPKEWIPTKEVSTAELLMEQVISKALFFLPSPQESEL